MNPFSLREKVAEGRMRGKRRSIIQHSPLTLTLSFRPQRVLMERGLFGCKLSHFEVIHV
jgi:hypothetical protein